MTTEAAINERPQKDAQLHAGQIGASQIRGSETDLITLRRQQAAFVLQTWDNGRFGHGSPF